MPTLRVPFAIDKKGIWYSPLTAEKGCVYYCPSCREPIIFRKGKIQKPQFVHKASDICKQQTIIRKIAKMLIQKAVLEWKSGNGSQPTIQRACPVCGKFTTQLLPEKIDGVILEYELTDNTIVDVALMAGEIPKAAVKIGVPNSIDKIKKTMIPIPCIELNGSEVIKNPLVWKTIADNFKQLICEDCGSIYLRFQAKTKQIAEASGIELPTSHYRYGFYECWKCKREIIVFTWAGNVMKDESEPEANSLPKTLQYRYSKMAGEKYWANTCPYCQSIQGNFFLYSEPDGPFFSLHFEEDSSFERDLMKIAKHAAEVGLL